MISVIIPVLNEAASIVSTLTHLRQLGGVDEVVVVDGGSVDGTPALARPYARVVSSERGRATQMNCGARAATGDVLLFLHADTRLPAGALRAVGAALQDSRVIGGRFRVRLNSSRWILRLVEWGINLRDRLIGGFTGDQAIFIRRDVFVRLGGYRQMPLMEDLDLGRRMQKEGRVVLLPLAATTSARRWEKDGVLRTVLLMWTLRLSYFAGVSPFVLKRFYGDTR